MTKLGTAILLIVSAIVGAGCDSNPTPHPMHHERDASAPNVSGGDVVGTELGANPAPEDQDPDLDSDCPCATPGRDDQFADGDDAESGKDDDNATDPCDDDNTTTASPEPDDPDTDAESPEPPPPTVKRRLP